MNPEQVIRNIVAALDQVQIPYMLTGLFASSFHGVPRSSNDIDFVIASTPDQLRALRKALPESEYYFDLEDALNALRIRSQFNVIELGTAWKVDFIIRKSRHFSRTEFERRVQTKVAGIPLVVVSAEDIVIAKLEWAKLSGSERQIEDVAGTVRCRCPFRQAYVKSPDPS